MLEGTSGVFKEIALTPLGQQNYIQYTTLSGEHADWVVAQLARTTSLGPGLKSEFLRKLTERKSDFIDRVRELDPPELRSRRKVE